MRVYFAPCGIGLGHVGRTIPIAKELIKKNARVMFSTYTDGIPYVEREGFPLFKAPPIKFQVKPDGSVDLKRSLVNPGPFVAPITLLKQINAELRSLGEFKPDIVVSDSRLSTLFAARILRIPRICILNEFQVIIPRKRRLLRLAKFADYISLTLIGEMWINGNTVLIPDFPPPYTISEGNLNIPKSYKKKVKLIGPILPVRPNELEDKKTLRERLHLPTGKRVIFVPISGPSEQKPFVTATLSKILTAFPDNYEIILSLGRPGKTEAPTRIRNVTIYEWLRNRFEYLKACDLMIARAGHGTLTQCMCYGKPMILIPTPSQTEQLTNAKQAQTIGIAEIIPQNQLNLERLLTTAKKMFETAIPEKAEQIAKEVLQYDGLANAVKIATEKATNVKAF
jgi:UDP-N-acetylglucosamine--N-acetylmuramyl-(pentapeptide) pyrophosphoryl-undecaprenol N-acetylglucosamine transferase